MLKTARHQDAAEALGREWMFLNVLAAVGSFPSPVAKFQHGEDHCIVMEFVQGARPGPARCCSRATRSQGPAPTSGGRGTSCGSS
ncbi:hypothetical protein [Streptomyces sp. NRRL S-378]|uniref:hypothetical protein n=1 Tax=Streptomyces sp. NRRL S-378 TaxID=1463904 RepID=UPI0004CA08D3|nr:hypothetical protein [Streptomyces sp. NRRL S-378]